MNEVPHPGFDKPEEYETFTTTNGLEEAAWKYAPDMPSYNIGGGYLPPQSRYDLRTAFKDGAKWQKEQDMDEWIKDRDGCFWDGVNEGKKAMREQMMKEAVEGRIGLVGFHNVVYVEEPKWTNIIDRFKEGDKVCIFVLKKEDEK